MSGRPVTPRIEHHNDCVLDDDPLLTVRSSAKYLTVSESSIRRAVLERSIDYVKIGGFHVRIRKSVLDALMQNVPATSGIKSA